MLSAIIFDMDGVVIDSHPVHKKSWSLFLASVGKKVSETELEFVLEGSKRESILRHFLGDLDEQQLHEFGQQKEALFRQQALSIKPISGFLRFIANVTSAGIPVALASCGSKRRVNYILDHLGIASHFDVVVTGDDVVEGKPDPAIFRIAAARLGADPPRTLVFEDAVAGVQAAKAAGMMCVGVAPDSRCRLLAQAGADRVIPHFCGLTLAAVQELIGVGTLSL